MGLKVWTWGARQNFPATSALYRDQRADIEAVLGPDLAFNIEQVFLHPAGPQLRHGVARGLLHDGDPFAPDACYACWLVLHLCLMPLDDHRAALGLPDLGPVAR